MTDPTPREGYTWPSPTAGPEGRPTQQQTPPLREQGAALTTRGQGVGLTRGHGAAVGAVFALVSVGGSVVTGLTLSVGLVAVAVGVAASGAALALPSLRVFAQGFLVASVVAGIGGVGAVFLFVAFVFTVATL